MLELEIVFENIKRLSWISKYTDYIKYRKLGLKKESQSLLKDFFLDLKVQDKIEQRFFINEIYKLAFLTEDYNLYLPENLNREIFIPEINRWIIEEPANAIPYKWSNNFEDNRKSIELDPTDQIALKTFINRVIGKISMNQHELTYNNLYDGNPEIDIDLINFSYKKVKNIRDSEEREKIYQTLNDLKENALKYK